MNKTSLRACSSGTHTLAGLQDWGCSQAQEQGSDLSGSLCMPLAGILCGTPV